MNSFYPLKVSKIRVLTANAVELKFEIPADLESKFNFKAGQYITIKHQIGGEQVRRSYSICSSIEEGISVGVKKVETGKMSSFLCNELKEGDNLEVMPPTGNFVLNSTKKTHIVGICAGSGITPIFSMIKTILLNNDNSNFTLIYGNKTMDSSMFAEELKAFQEVNPDRFKIHWAFSQEKMVNTINGRLDKNNIQQLLHTFPDLKSADAYFLCGPGDLIDQTNELLLNQVAQNNIHFERFTTTKKEEETTKQIKDITANVLVSIDGDDFEFQLSSNGQSILDAAMDAGADVPFSCKGAVCCTCKAKVMEGKAIMDKNFSLSDDEVAQGYILTCQSHPITENIVVDYDEM